MQIVLSSARDIHLPPGDGVWPEAEVQWTVATLLSPPLCRGQVWSPPGKYQPLTFNFGNIKMLCSVLALSPSTECSFKWWPPHHLTSPFPALTGSWATWRHFYQIWTSWRPGERVSGGWRVFRRTEDVSFHYIPHLGGRAYEYLWLLLFSGSGPTGPPPPCHGESASIDPVMVVTWPTSFGHAGVTLNCPRHNIAIFRGVPFHSGPLHPTLLFMCLLCMN